MGRSGRVVGSGARETGSTAGCHLPVDGLGLFLVSLHKGDRARWRFLSALVGPARPLGTRAADHPLAGALKGQR